MIQSAINTTSAVALIVAAFSILSGCDISRFNRDASPHARAERDIRALQIALNQFRLDNFRYPTAEEGLGVLRGGSHGVSDEELKEYLPRLPVDPWGQDYNYRIPGRDGSPFDVYTFGADQAEGGDGVDADVGNWTLTQ